MLYDYKSHIIVQEEMLDCLCPLVEDIIAEYHNLRRFDFVAVYCPAYIADMIMTKLLDDDELCMDEDSELEELLACEDNEVLLTINNEGLILLEEARSYDGTIKTADGVINYLHDSFTTKDVSNLAESCKPVLVFGLEEETFNGIIERKKTENGYFERVFFSKDDLTKDQLMRFISNWD